jgi:membrane-associated phospholipid phosphatase
VNDDRNNRRFLEFLSLSLLLGLIAAVGALLFFAWLTNEMLAGETAHFDAITRDFVHQFASPTLTATMRGISFIGSSLFLTTASIAMFIWFMSRHWRRDAYLFGITMLGAAILNTTLKLTFKRPRPVPFFNLLAPESFSFPSGHSLASFCFFGALATILAARIHNRTIHITVWTIASVLVFLIGLSRIYLGVHYTTDVIAGFTAALIWILTVGFVERRITSFRKQRQMSDML